MPYPGYWKSDTTFSTASPPPHPPAIPVALDTNYCYCIDGEQEPWRDQGTYLSKWGWGRVKESGVGVRGWIGDSHAQGSGERKTT